MRPHGLVGLALLLLSGAAAVAQGLEFPPPSRPPAARPAAPGGSTGGSGSGTAPAPANPAPGSPASADAAARDGVVYPTQTFSGVSEASELAPGDTVLYSVAEDAGTRFEGTRELRVGADGTLQVPILGTVNVAKKTVRSVESLVKAGLEKDYYQTATVRITLLSRATVQGAALGSVYVQGEVNRPGRQEIPPNETFTLTKAITQAGEFGRFANKKEIVLTRKGKDGALETRTINYLEIEKGRAPDIELKHDDQIRVKEKLFSIGN